MFLDDLLASNRAWVAERAAEPLPAVEPIALAVIACYDPRLDDLLLPALGLEDGEAFLLRTAGAVVTPTGLRSLTLAVYLFDVHQVLVVGHTSCRMAHFPTADFIDAFRRRGVARAAFGGGDLRTWAGAVPSPRQGVLASISAIAGAPFLPSDLALAGAVLDDRTGELEAVYRPGDVAPKAPVPVAAAAAGDAGKSEGEPPPAPEETQPAAPAPPPPRLGTAQPAAGAPLGRVLSVIEDLGKKRGLRQELAKLRAALEQERDPARQLTLLHQFVQGAAGESKEVRQAFETLKREGAAAGTRVVSEFILPLLTGRKRR